MTPRDIARHVEQARVQAAFEQARGRALTAAAQIRETDAQHPGLFGRPRLGRDIVSQCLRGSLARRP